MHYRDVLSKFGNLVMDGTDSTTTKHSGATANNLETYQPFKWAHDAASAHPNDFLVNCAVPKNESVAMSVELVALPPSSSGLQGFVSRCVSDTNLKKPMTNYSTCKHRNFARL